jgi:D-alanine-D-alanine ligase
MRIAVAYNQDARSLASGEEKDRIAVAGAATAAAAVAHALAERGHHAVPVALEDDALEFAARLTSVGAQAVFNICESFKGKSRNEGAVAGLLELLGIPYTGNPAATLFLARDKERTKAVLRSDGVRVAQGLVLSSAEDLIPRGLRYPLFVKTRFEDASHGISASNLCADESALRERVSELFTLWRQDVLVEEYLPGRELNVALLERPRRALGYAAASRGEEQTLPTEAVEVLPISEIDFGRLAQGRPPIVTFDSKWVEESPDYHDTPVICPAPLEEPLKGEVVRTALAAWTALGCRGYARVDIRLDALGRPVTLEVNPNPDISPDAGFARSASKAGIAYDALVERIVEVAVDLAGAGTGRWVKP